MFLGNPKDIGRQLKYADQRKSRVAIIVGSDEVDRGVVQLKDLDLGLLLSKEIQTNEEWKERPSQTEVISFADERTPGRPLFSFN